jgi:hypothetical protein
MEEADEQLLGRFRFLIASAVRHWLATTGLVIRIFEIDLEIFEQFNSGYSYFGIEHIHVAWDHQSSFHILAFHHDRGSKTRKVGI